MKKETSRRRRFRVFFRRRRRLRFRRLRDAVKAWLGRRANDLREVVRFVKEIRWRDVEAWLGRWFCRLVDDLKIFDAYIALFFKKIWCVSRSIPFLASLFLLLAEGGLRVGFDLGLTLWVKGRWDQLSPPNEVSDLRPSLITAGAALLAASVAAGFFAWRNRTADKQLANAQLSLQEERYKKGVELLAHESLVIRIGGLYTLHQLAEDFPKTWALPVLDLMCTFVRTPPLDKEKAEESGEKPLRRDVQEPVQLLGIRAEGSGKKPLRRDVQEAVQLLGLRSPARREAEKLEQKKAKKEGRGKSPGGGSLDFRGADLAGGSWEGVDLEGARFFEAKLTGVGFRGATLTGADFREATLTRAGFRGAMLTGADFSGATLMGADFSRAMLTRAFFFRAMLTGAYFFRAMLTGAYFYRATLTRADFWRATLDGADFSRATLTRAFFYRATLTGANFSRATLTRADFSRAMLTGARFEGATLTGARLMRANLSGVILLASRSFMGKKKSSPVRGVTRKQLEAGWIEEEGRPPLKIVEDEDGDGRKTMTLTEADWKEIGLDPPPPKFRVGPYPRRRRSRGGDLPLFPDL